MDVIYDLTLIYFLQVQSLKKQAQLEEAERTIEKLKIELTTARHNYDFLSQQLAVVKEKQQTLQVERQELVTANTNLEQEVLFQHIE